MIHIGKVKYPAGRHLRDSAETEPPSIALADTFKRLNFPINRATTGTPPRLKKNTINYDGLESHGSDNPIEPFNFVHEFNKYKPEHELILCHLTYTNQ